MLITHSVDIIPELTDADYAWTIGPAQTAETEHVTTDTVDLVVDALLDAQAYRTLAQSAIHSLHERERQFTRLQASYHQALDDLRRLRTGAA